MRDTKYTEERRMAGIRGNLQSSEGNNTRELEVPPYAVAGAGAGGLVVVSVTIVVLGIACIYCCKRRHRQNRELNVGTSSPAAGNGDDNVRLLSMRQSPASTLPSSSSLPIDALNSVFITLDITPGELDRLYEREEGTGRSGGDEERCAIERSTTCTPELPPRTKQMLQIVTSECDARTLSTEATNTLSQPNTPPWEHHSPSSATHFFSTSQPTTSLAGLHSPTSVHHHSSPSPHPPPSPPPPQSPISPSHTHLSTSPHHQPPHTPLPHSPSPTSPLHSQPSTSPPLQPSTSPLLLERTPQFPSQSTTPIPPPLPPKPEIRFQSTSDSEQDTPTGSYCILMKGPPQLPLLAPDATSSNKQERMVHQLNMGQPFNQDTTQSVGGMERKHAEKFPSFLEDSLNQNTRVTEEEQSPPPRPPKPAPSSPRATSTTGKQAPPTPPLSSPAETSTTHKSRPPPIPWDPPPSLLPPREQGGRSSEGSISLPPRCIRRYPVSSSGSSSGPGTAGSMDQEEEGEEGEVFLKYNQSYHTIIKHFHSDRLHTQ